MDEEEANEPSEVPQPIAALAASEIPKETVRVVVRAEKVPTMLPSGPNGTWRCEEEGCGYIVRSAQEQEGKDLIAKHFQDHEKRVEKLNLALSEGTRGHMPIKYAYFPPSFFIQVVLGDGGNGGDQNTTGKKP
jgi:hypothetical protein